LPIFKDSIRLALDTGLACTAFHYYRARIIVAQHTLVLPIVVPQGALAPAPLKVDLGRAGTPDTEAKDQLEIRATLLADLAVAPAVEGEASLAEPVLAGRAAERAEPDMPGGADLAGADHAQPSPVDRDAAVQQRGRDPAVGLLDWEVEAYRGGNRVCPELG
jgi:hypothetical protein